jgi:hypothetical protein
MQFKSEPFMHRGKVVTQIGKTRFLVEETEAGGFYHVTNLDDV